ncbi:tryptophan--tRNA ligase, cytoplasmic-like isoform X2 [Zingiber officinale]|uniref:tryptophan--tRNA ligase, cytoplasmic-like isoform X2 n=1 Tax=Zingiber officinale TaxID=94328 RepID=UPI001C4ACE4C|nr:tryptophan--tRNA ligase, cytoplasmic-like isoform X2 [Zingiber officinale]
MYMRGARRSSSTLGEVPLPRRCIWDIWFPSCSPRNNPCEMIQVLDIPIKYLSFFLEDDAKLDHIKKEYGAGRMLTGEVKKCLIEVLSEMVERHCKARALVTDEVVDAFMAVRHSSLHVQLGRLCETIFTSS